MVSCSSDKLIKVWNFKPDVRPFTYKGHKRAITSVDLNSTASLVASSSMDGTIKLWVNKVSPKFRSVKAHSAPVESVEFSPND